MDSPEFERLGVRPLAEVLDTPHAPIVAEVVDEDPQPRPRRVLLPVILFLATCVSTFLVGGPIYAAGLMVILTCHEFGHFLQAVRYRVPASLPFFIPMPLSPLGTMGAVIGMSGNMGNRKSLFDIGISGPLAGLVPALIFSVVGLHWSSIVDVTMVNHAEQTIAAPPIFRFLIHYLLADVQPHQTVDLHPLAFAGWVGMLITALNLFPIGQLDGGHILYALLRRNAHRVSSLVLGGALVAMLISGSYQWLLMVFLLFMMGPNHPPTADDDMPLGLGRTILGWATLAFLLIGFTPTPFLN